MLFMWKQVIVKSDVAAAATRDNYQAPHWVKIVAIRCYAPTITNFYAVQRYGCHRITENLQQVPFQHIKHQDRIVAATCLQSLVVGWRGVNGLSTRYKAKNLDDICLKILLQSALCRRSHVEWVSKPAKQAKKKTMNFGRAHCRHLPLEFLLYLMKFRLDGVGGALLMSFCNKLSIPHLALWVATSTPKRL